MRAISNLALILALGLLVIRAQAENEKNADLAALEAIYSADQTSASAPLAKLAAEYRASLEKAKKQFQEAGDLKSLLAAKSALEEIDCNEFGTALSCPVITKIRESYLKRKAEVEETVRKSMTIATEQHIAALEKLIVEQTKAGRIEEAMVIQAAMEKVATPADPLPEASKASAAAKKKAMEEFPALADPRSELSVAVRNRVRERRAQKPAYFSDPQWPLLLARETADAINRRGVIPITSGIDVINLLTEAQQLHGGSGRWTEQEINAANKALEERIKSGMFDVRIPGKIILLLRGIRWVI